MYNTHMISTKLSAVLLLIIGTTIFVVPQDWLRRLVKNWRDGYSYAFWLAKLIALIMITIGLIGIFLAK